MKVLWIMNEIGIYIKKLICRIYQSKYPTVSSISQYALCGFLNITAVICVKRKLVPNSAMTGTHASFGLYQV